MYRPSIRLDLICVQGTKQGKRECRTQYLQQYAERNTADCYCTPTTPERIVLNMKQLFSSGTLHHMLLVA